jgi:hypothetical protein
MPQLTRRRDPNARLESWLVSYGDLQVGTIGLRSGVPGHVDPWTWRCGLPQVIVRGLRTDGTAATFEKARTDFEAAWQKYLPRCTDADFEQYRRHQAWTAWKYRMKDTGLLLPTATASGRSRCFCGMEIGDGFAEHVYAEHMEAA